MKNGKLVEKLNFHFYDTNSLLNGMLCAHYFSVMTTTVPVSL